MYAMSALLCCVASTYLVPNVHFNAMFECCHASCVGVFLPCVINITTHNLLMYTSYPKVSISCICSKSHCQDACLFLLQSGLLHGPPTHQAHEGSSSNFLPQTYQEPFPRTGSGEEERLKRQAARRTGNAMHACLCFMAYRMLICHCTEDSVSLSLRCSPLLSAA